MFRCILRGFVWLGLVGCFVLACLLWALGSGCWLARLRCLLGLVVLLEWFSLADFGFVVSYGLGSVGMVLGWVLGIVVFDCDFMVVLLLLFWFAVRGVRIYYGCV